VKYSAGRDMASGGSGGVVEWWSGGVVEGGVVEGGGWRVEGGATERSAARVAGRSSGLMLERPGTAENSIIASFRHNQVLLPRSKNAIWNVSISATIIAQRQDRAALR
jgi:hypothetical protein